MSKENMADNYQPETINTATHKNIATKNEENIEVGRGVKQPHLHGQHTLETKRKFSKNEPNQVELEESWPLEVRKAITLDYIEGGGDGRGAAVDERIEAFKAANPEWIDMAEIDEIYPTSDITKSEIDRGALKHVKTY